MNYSVTLGARRLRFHQGVDEAVGELLTAALSQGYGGSKVSDAVFADFDFINIMAYDGAGSWAPKSPGQHSSMACAQRNVKY